MPEWLFDLVLRGVEVLEWLAILIARLGVGLMFAISGWHKLRNPERHRQMVETMGRASVPCPWLTGPLVATTEVTAGSLLVLGLLTTPAAAALLVVTIVAIATVTIDEVDGKRPTNWLENFLYMPEVLYVIILLWLITSGPGAISLDYLLWRAVA